MTAAALLIGAACGLRTFSGPVVLTRHRVLIVTGAAELIVDKTPLAPARTTSPSLAARALSGAFCGRALAGRPAPAAAAALIAAFGGLQTRGALGGRSGIADMTLALAEDGLAYGAAFVAVRMCS